MKVLFQSMTRPRNVVAAVLVAVAVVAGLVVLSKVNRRRMPFPPLPPNAMHVSDTFGPMSFYRQVSFEMALAYPDETVIEFFAIWAEENGWERVGPDRERWSTYGWETFVDVSKGKKTIDRYLEHWASEDRRWSLRIAVRYVRPEGKRDRGNQMVSVTVGRFNLIDQQQRQ